MRLIANGVMTAPMRGTVARPWTPKGTLATSQGGLANRPRETICSKSLAHPFAVVSIEPIGSFGFQILDGRRRQSRCVFEGSAICDNVRENGSRQLCPIETCVAQFGIG